MQQIKVALLNSTIYIQTKPRIRQDGRAWFSRLIWHLARKWSRRILSTPEPT